MFRAIGLALWRTSKILGSNRMLWLPFIVAAFVEALCIGLIWLAPHPPFSAVLAPPIRYFFGDKVLHYPWHLWFLYYAMKHTYLIASILVGAFMSGIACAMVRQLYEGRTLSFRTALSGGSVRYGTVVLIWIVACVSAMAAARYIGHLGTKITWWPYWGWTAIAATFLLQALFVYAIPIAVFRRTSWLKALLLSFWETLRFPFSTFVVLILPYAALLAFTLDFPPSRVAEWMMASQPEIALFFVAGRLIVWTIVDSIITVAVAHIWWIRRRQQLEAVQRAAAIRGWLKEGPAVA